MCLYSFIHSYKQTCALSLPDCLSLYVDISLGGQETNTYMHADQYLCVNSDLCRLQFTQALSAYKHSASPTPSFPFFLEQVQLSEDILPTHYLISLEAFPQLKTSMKI